MLKIIKSSIVVLVVILTSAILLINILLRGTGQEKNLDELKDFGINVYSQSIPYQDDSINTILIGDRLKPKVLFIHGSPGQWFDWSKVFKDEQLLKSFCLITYDRPGLGLTSVPAKEKLEDQAKIASKVMLHYGQNAEKYVLVGHSYGGAVAEQLLLDFPELILKAIYAGPTLSPELQKVKWYNRLASFSLINMILPKVIQSSNHEMMGLRTCLNKNRSRLSTIKQPIIFIQGKKDILVPFETVDYYKKYKPEGVEYIIDEEMNHFIPWSHPQLVIDVLLDL